MSIKLKYVGKAPDDPEFVGYLVGVPLEDHEVATEIEAKERIASGLYKRAKEND